MVQGYNYNVTSNSRKIIHVQGGKEIAIGEVFREQGAIVMLADISNY